LSILFSNREIYAPVREAFRRPQTEKSKYTQMKKLLLWLIDIYKKKISPHTRRKCRFYPTCSTYAREAIMLHGAFRGTLLAFLRIMRCNPFNPGGIDKVPAASNFKIYMKAMFGFGQKRKHRPTV
jgi:putative membrane protein insertion efficiency factor